MCLEKQRNATRNLLWEPLTPLRFELCTIRLPVCSVIAALGGLACWCHYGLCGKWWLTLVGEKPSNPIRSRCCKCSLFLQGLFFCRLQWETLDARWALLKFAVDGSEMEPIPFTCRCIHTALIFFIGFLVLKSLNFYNFLGGKYKYFNFTTYTVYRLRINWHILILRDETFDFFCFVDRASR